MVHELTRINTNQCYSLYYSYYLLDCFVPRNDAKRIVIARLRRKNAFFKHAEIDEFSKLPL